MSRTRVQRRGSRNPVAANNKAIITEINNRTWPFTVSPTSRLLANSKRIDHSLTSRASERKGRRVEKESQFGPGEFAVWVFEASKGEPDHNDVQAYLRALDPRNKDRLCVVLEGIEGVIKGARYGREFAAL